MEEDKTTKSIIGITAESRTSRPAEKDGKKVVSKRRSKSQVTPPVLTLPEVPLIDKEATLQMMRTRKLSGRGIQRVSTNRGQNVQHVLKELVGGPKKAGTPCGQCECCKSLLSYVTVLRNFMDHVVSGMSQGVANETEEATPRPPCILCSVQPVQHVEHAPKVATETSKQPQVQSDTLSHGSSQSKSSQSQLNHNPQPNNINHGINSGSHSAPISPSHQSSTGAYSNTNIQSPSIQSPPPNVPFFQGSSSFNSPSIVTDPSSQNTAGNINQSQFSQSSSQQSTIQSHDPGSQSSTQSSQSNTTQIHYPSAQQSSTQSSQLNTTTQSHDPSSQQSTTQSSQLNTTQSNSSSQQSYTQNSPSKTALGHQLNVPEVSTQSHQPILQSINNTNTTPETRVHEPPSEFEKIAWNVHKKNQELRVDSVTSVEQQKIIPNAGDNRNISEENVEPEEELDTEAYITVASDNVTAFACLVLGHSLILSGTTRALVVLVTDDVSAQMRTLLSTVFDYVQSLDKTSPGLTSLSLLEEPELGLSFRKLLVWGIEPFAKAVFLDPNTLVVQGCDELFEREELSAVADIGWPDCFDTDVFVFRPSLETFWHLLQFAETQDNVDGGDQSLLNMYFKKDWFNDISKKLPFLYNMRANVSYTYKPAFKHFGNQVKIVNFFGSYKPMDVQFHSPTGQMAADANVHPTFAQFVYYWLEIFTKRVVPILPQEVQDYLAANKYVCAMDIAKFYPSPNRAAGMETLPTPPSFRVYAGSLERRASHPVIDPSNSQSAEENSSESDDTTLNTPESVEGSNSEQPEVAQAEEPGGLPGTQLGNYQGMSAWEAGCMDYLGQHKSDTILARLDYFIKGKSNETNNNEP